VQEPPPTQGGWTWRKIERRANFSLEEFALLLPPAVRRTVMVPSGSV
jgi:hypothetical protein